MTRTSSHDHSSPVTAREAPGPRTFPGIGLLLAMRSDPLHFLTDVASRYGGVVKLGQLGRRTVYFVEAPEGVKHILADNARNYVRGPVLEVLRPVMGDSAIMSEGDSWLRKRRKMQPAFHHQRIAGLVPLMTGAIAEMLNRWRATAKPSVPLNISLEMTRLTMQLICKTMFSADIDGKLDELIPAWTAANEWVSEHILMPVRIPESWPTPSNLKLQRAMRAIRGLLLQLIQRRRQGQGRSAADQVDLLSMLLAARDEETSEGFTDEQLVHELVQIMFAGFETTALPLAWTWHFLSRYPEAARRVAAEVDEVLGERTPTAEDLPRLKYTRMVFDESVRMLPPFWLLPRMPLKDDVVCGYRIPANSDIFLSPYVTQHDPAQWENPEAFDPERFTPERSEGRHRYAYFPFGGGPRMCIGQGMALIEAQLVIAMVVQAYSLYLGPDPVALVVGNALRPRRDIHMLLRPRVA